LKSAEKRFLSPEFISIKRKTW